MAARPPAAKRKRERRDGDDCAQGPKRVFISPSVQMAAIENELGVWMHTTVQLFCDKTVRAAASLPYMSNAVRMVSFKKFEADVAALMSTSIDTTQLSVKKAMNQPVLATFLGETFITTRRTATLLRIVLQLTAEKNRQFHLLALRAEDRDMTAATKKLLNAVQKNVAAISPSTNTTSILKTHSDDATVTTMCTFANIGLPLQPREPPDMNVKAMLRRMSFSKPKLALLLSCIPESFALVILLMIHTL